MSTAHPDPKADAPTTPRQTFTATDLWKRNPEVVFKHLQLATSATLSFIIELLEICNGMPPDTPLSNVLPTRHNKFDLVYGKARTILTSTPISNYLNLDSPVYFDTQPPGTFVGRVSGSSYHDLAQGLIFATLRMIHSKTPVSQFLHGMLFHAGKGEIGVSFLALPSTVDASDIKLEVTHNTPALVARLIEIRNHVTCENKAGVDKWKAECAEKKESSPTPSDLPLDDMVGPLLVKQWLIVFGHTRNQTSKRLKNLLTQTKARQQIGNSRGWYVLKTELTTKERDDANQILTDQAKQSQKAQQRGEANRRKKPTR